MGNGKGEWITILSKYRLMKNGHHDDDDRTLETKTSALRFYLIQPSSNWTSFGLRDLMCYTLIEKTKQKQENENSDMLSSTMTVDEQTQSKQLNIQNAAL